MDTTERYYVEIHRSEFASDLTVDIGVITDNGIQMTTHEGDLAYKLYLSLLRLNVVPPKKELMKSNIG